LATLDWEQIENEYVTGQVSYQALAKRYKISTKQVARQGKARGWLEKRRQFRLKTSAEGLQKAEVEASEASALIFRIGRLILERFLAALQDGGVKLTPADAERWAKVLLELERAGKEAQAVGVVFGADVLAEAASELRRWRESKQGSES
jgi:hypothetical protein